MAAVLPTEKDFIQDTEGKCLAVQYKHIYKSFYR